MPAFDDAVFHYRKNDNLGIGIHLNLSLGRPVLPAARVRTLVDNQGFFITNYYRFVKFLLSLKESNLFEIEEEFRAQIERVINKRIRLDHINSHIHIHMFPRIFKIVIKLAKEYNIPAVRFSNEKLMFGIFKKYYPLIPHNLKEIFQHFNDFKKILFLKILANFNRKCLKKSGLHTADYFFGAFLMGQMRSRQYVKIFNIVGDGYTEIVCHPGYIDDEIIAMNDPLIKERPDELKTLLDPELKKITAEKNISLVTFRDMLKP